LWAGDYILSVNLNGHINYLDKSTPNKPSRILKGHSNFVKSVAFDKSHNKLFTASYDFAVVEWDVDTGDMKSVDGKGHTNDIPALQVADGKLYSCSMDDSARITPTGKSFDDGVRIALDSPAQDIAPGKNGHSVVVSMKHVFLLNENKVVSNVAVPWGPKSVAVSVDGTEAAVGGEDNLIHLFKISGDTISESGKVEGMRGAVLAVGYSPDGQYLAAGDTLREVKVYDASSKALKIEGWCFHAAKVTDLAWSPDSLHLATASLDSHIYVWDVKDTKKKIYVKDAHKLGANGVTWIDNNTIATVGQDACLKIWNLTY